MRFKGDMPKHMNPTTWQNSLPSSSWRYPPKCKNSEAGRQICGNITKHRMLIGPANRQVRKNCFCFLFLTLSVSASGRLCQQFWGWGAWAKGICCYTRKKTSHTSNSFFLNMRRFEETPSSCAGNITTDVKSCQTFAASSSNLNNSSASLMIRPL